MTSRLKFALFTFLFISSKLKDQLSFSDRLSSVLSLSVNFSHSEGDLIFFKGRAMPISNYEIAKIHWRNSLLQNHWANSTKLVTKHPWVKGIQICSNEGPCPFLRGDDYKIAVFSHVSDVAHGPLVTFYHLP